MLVGVVDDVGGVGAPDGDRAVVQSAREVLLIRQRQHSRGNVVNVLVGLAILDGQLLGEVLQLFFIEPFRDLLEEVLDVDVVGIVIRLLREELRDFKLLGVGPAVDDLFGDVYEPSLLELLLLLELDLGVDEVQEGLEPWQLVAWVVVVAGLDKVLCLL